MTSATSYSDPALESARKKIQQAEDQLADLEDQLALCEDDDHEYHQMIRDQQDYLAGLHSGYNRMLRKRGM